MHNLKSFSVLHTTSGILQDNKIFQHQSFTDQKICPHLFLSQSDSGGITAAENHWYFTYQPFFPKLLSQRYRDFSQKMQSCENECLGTVCSNPLIFTKFHVPHQTSFGFLLDFPTWQQRRPEFKGNQQPKPAKCFRILQFLIFTTRSSRIFQSMFVVADKIGLST